MNKTIAVCCAVLLVFSTVANAGRGGGGSGGGRSSGIRSSGSGTGASRTSLARPSPAMSRAGQARSSAGTASMPSRLYVASASGGYRASDSGERIRVSVAPSVAGRLFVTRVAGSSGAGYRSLSAAQVAPKGPVPSGPSPGLQTIIREREVSSGPGWMGTAALVWLLSRNNLSDDDRRWVSSQISQSVSSQDSDAGDQPSIDRLGKALTFTYEGLSEIFKVGEIVKIKISAIDKANRRQALTCSVSGVGVARTPPRFELTDLGVTLTWKPDRGGIIFLQCDGLTEGERRAIEVST